MFIAPLDQPTARIFLCHAGRLVLAPRLLECQRLLEVAACHREESLPRELRFRRRERKYFGQGLNSMSGAFGLSV
jgi:hypothetical protein